MTPDAVRVRYDKKRVGDAPMERIFASGMREFFKLREKRVSDTGDDLFGVGEAHTHMLSVIFALAMMRSDALIPTPRVPPTFRRRG